MDGTCAAPGTTITGVWEFTYDGDGTLVAQVYSAGGNTTATYYYRGRSYQVTIVGEDETITKYYAFGGTTIAMDDGSGLQYFLTDHLGSTVAITAADGTLVSEQRYLPFGGVCTDVGNITQTDFGYTGQREKIAGGLGLMDYNARFYGQIYREEEHSSAGECLNLWVKNHHHTPAPGAGAGVRGLSRKSSGTMCGECASCTHGIRHSPALFVNRPGLSPVKGIIRT